MGSTLTDIGDDLFAAGRHDAAARAYAAAEAAGEPRAALALAFALREAGRRDEAFAAAKRASATGDLEAAGVVACWRWCTSEDVTLEYDLRHGAPHFPSCRADLGTLLARTGRRDEAIAVWTEGLDHDESESIFALARDAEEHGDEPRAELLYRLVIAIDDDAHAHHNLATILLDRDDVDGAREHYAIAAAAGDSLAAEALTDLDR